VSAVHDVSDGGLLVAVAEMALAGGIGADVSSIADHRAAFGEDQARYVVTTADPDAIAAEGVVIARIGTTGGDAITVADGAVSLAALRAAHEAFFPSLMGADAALA
jgi:phosphoribosylformylglycinamidine (FGAM) synthase-like enzyme